MTQLQQRIQVVRSRLQRQWMWSCLSWGLIAGGAAACLIGLLRLLELGCWSIGLWGCHRFIVRVDNATYRKGIGPRH